MKQSKTSFSTLNLSKQPAGHRVSAAHWTFTTCGTWDQKHTKVNRTFLPPCSLGGERRIPLSHPKGKDARYIASTKLQTGNNTPERTTITLSHCYQQFNYFNICGKDPFYKMATQYLSCYSNIDLRSGSFFFLLWVLTCYWFPHYIVLDDLNSLQIWASPEKHGPGRWNTGKR